MTLSPHSLLKNDQEVEYTPPFATFSDFLSERAQKYGEKPAVVYVDTGSQNEPLTISYHQLQAVVQQVAAQLSTTWHLTPGDSLSFAFPNTPEVIILNYAAWSLGLKTVPLDTTRDTTDRKIYKLEQTHAKLFFTRSDEKTLTENAEIKSALPDLTIIPVNSFIDFQQLIALASEAGTPPTVVTHTIATTHPTDLNQDSLILYTSGTTALPKGCQLTLKSLFANAESIAAWLQFNETDRFHVLLPLHHINSTTFVNTTLLAGGTVILSSHYSKSKFWEIMASSQATGASIVPTIAYDLLSETAAFQQHFPDTTAAGQQIRRIQLGSAPVQPTVVKEFIETFGVKLMQGYGQTETSLRSTGVPMELTPEEYAQTIELNTLGTELKYTNVTVLRPDGSEAAAEEEGELCVRGPVIMTGYLNNPEATAEAFAHDWFHSGDTGSYQELFGRRFYFLKGRTKEILKKGGVLISPLAIENALLSAYPDLEQVYVVGFPDARMGELIGIVATSQNPHIVEKILSDAAQGQIKNVTAYELPQAGLLVTDDDLPKTSTGKVQRINLREMYGAQLLEQFRTVATVGSGDKKTTLRVIGGEESSLLERAAQIDATAWGSTLCGDVSQMKERAENGVFIGLFDHQKNLVGTISALQIATTELEKIGAQNTLANTWDGVTDHGTLKTHSHKGDALLLVAVAVQSAHTAERKNESEDLPSNVLPPELPREKIDGYIHADQDPVMKFHRTPKGGLNEGARIVKIIERGRPADTQAVGYNVLMEYPPLAVEPQVNSESSWGTQLVEAAFLYAYKQGIKKVFAYSRPAGLLQFLKNQSAQI